MNDRRNLTLILFLLVCFLASDRTGVSAQTPTTFTYQGKLSDSGAPANGTYDLEFKLYDAANAQVGSTVTREDVPVVNGAFTVQLDFGSVFDGSTRTLEIGVRPGPSVGPFTTLAPRQPVTSTPEAIHSAAAQTATNATQLGGVPASGFLLNTTTQQTGNLNISGNGLVGANVGIGTTSPAARLHVANASNSGGGLIVEASEGDRAAMYYNPNTGLVFDSFRPGDGRRLPVLLQPSGGNVGIGTTSPATKLTVQTGSDNRGISHTDGTISLSTFLGAGRGFLGTFSDHPLSLFTSNTTRMTIDTAGNVSIGNFTPQHRLVIFGGPSWTSNLWSGAVELSNASAIGWRSNAGGQRFGIGQSTGGLYFFRTGADPGTTTCGTPPVPCPANYNLLFSDIGSVIIAPGATPPTAGIALEVNGATLMTTGGSGGKIQFGTPSFETGMTVIGTNRADFRFDGLTLKLLAGTGTGAMASTNGIAIHTSGNVGIGTTTPRAKLDVVGNVVQDRGSNGLVKAMAFVDGSNTIVRCYNSTLTGSAATTPPCGFQNLMASGNRQIDFGFQVDDRFVSVTANQVAGSTASFLIAGGVPTSLIIPTTPSNAPFMIVVH